MHVLQDPTVADFNSAIKYTLLYEMKNWNTDDIE